MKRDLTPKEYCEILEEELLKQLEQNKYKKIPFPLPNSSERKKRIICAVISSILFKQLVYETKYGDNNKKQIGSVVNILFKLKVSMMVQNNNVNPFLYRIINQNATEILKELKKYYKRNQQNYIFRKLPVQIINEHNNIKELLYWNPFLFQESLELYYNPLT